MGGFSLLHNDHFFQDMPVYEVDPHRRPCRLSARASLHWAYLRAFFGQEGHAIFPRIFPRGRGFPTPSRLCRSPMLSHLVTHHISRRHLLPALPVLYPSILSVLVGGALPRYPYPVRRLRLIPRRLSGAADHSDCIPDISPQAHPIKQADQVFKCTLDPEGVQRCNHDIFCIEDGSLVPTLLSTLSPLLRALY